MTQATKKTLEILAGRAKTAAADREAAGLPPEPKEMGHEIGKNLKRAIPEGHSYDPKALKPLAKMLWQMSVALGHSMAAHRQFTKLKSSTVSPDGLIGGRGYVMSVKDVRKMLYEACEALSAISDTIHDEINAPHWKPQLAKLEKEDAEGIERLIGDAERILDDPEADAEDDAEEAEEHGAEWHHPAVRENNKKKKGDPKSEVPGAGDKETIPSKGPHPADSGHPLSRVQKQASYSRIAESIEDLSAVSDKRSNSSLPVETLPGGPRVDHLDRGDQGQDGPFGSYNRDEPFSTHDQWSRDQGVGGEYNYPSDLNKQALFNSAPSAMKSVLARIAHIVKSMGVEHVAIHGVSSDSVGEASLSLDTHSFSKALTKAQGSDFFKTENKFGVTEPARKALYTLFAAFARNGNADSLGSEASPLKVLWVTAATLDPTKPASFCIEGVKSKLASSNVPDSNTDNTPTEGFDFGIGRGNGNDAHGQGAGGYGNSNPSSGNRGVYGPRAELPHDPGGKLHDDEVSDTMPAIENAVGDSIPKAAAGELPNDDEPPVARSDYYSGPKDNLVDTGLSNVGSTEKSDEPIKNVTDAEVNILKKKGLIYPGGPTLWERKDLEKSGLIRLDDPFWHKWDHKLASGELPGDDQEVDYQYGRDEHPGAGYTYERDNQPYIKWDYNTPEMRPDSLYQRDIEGPYIHNDLANEDES